ncbi:MAG: hypothetical protein ACOX1Y_14710 [Zhaonellaceae bacterium]|jgi:hypothetical protein
MYEVEEIAPNLSTYAATITLKASRPKETSLWQEQSQELFNYLANNIKKTPKTIIGHLKGYLNLGEQGYYYFSNVGSPTTNFSGQAKGKTEEARLDVNLLVFNLAHEKISQLLQQGLKKYFDDFSFQLVEERED